MEGECSDCLWRGETLALGLESAGFKVQVFDFTSAYGPEWQRGAGPFPIVMNEFSSAQHLLLAEVRKLERGLAYWTPEGPLN